MVERARAWASERGLQPVIVFDRRAPGGLVGEREEADGSLLVGTGGESADDWLTRRARELHERAEPYWLVTSDRELRSRAGGNAERTIGGGAFAGELTGT